MPQLAGYEREDENAINEANSVAEAWFTGPSFAHDGPGSTGNINIWTSTWMPSGSGWQTDGPGPPASRQPSTRGNPCQSVQNGRLPLRATFPNVYVLLQWSSQHPLMRYPGNDADGTRNVPASYWYNGTAYVDVLPLTIFADGRELVGMFSLSGGSTEQNGLGRNRLAPVVAARNRCITGGWSIGDWNGTSDNCNNRRRGFRLCVTDDRRRSLYRHPVERGDPDTG